MAGILGIKSCMLMSVIITIESRHLKQAAGTLAICPKYGIHKFAHKNCNRYYECSNGILFAKSCDHDKLFDTKSKRCLKTHLVKCEHKAEKTEETSWDTFTPRSRRYSSGNISQIAFNADGCPIDTTIKWKIPHQKCEKYYECKRGQPKVRECPSGKLFDVEKLKCVKDSNAQCDQFIYVEQEDSRNHMKLNEFSCPDDYNIEWRVPHKNCNQYYQCKDGALEPHRCPVNMVYNIDTRACDSFKNVDCANRYVNKQHLIQSNSKPRRRITNKYDDEVGPKHKEMINKYTLQLRAEEVCADPVTNGVTLPFGEPNGYYICVDGEAVLKYCSAGLQYNHKAQKCDWLDTDSQDTYINNAEQVCSKENQQSLHNTLLPHENCNQYYKCGKNVPVARYCQSGFLFDTKLGKCDWAANVNCGLRRYDDKR